MSRMLSLLSVLILTVACQPGDPGTIDPAVEHRYRVAEDLDATEEESWSIDLSSDLAIDAAVGPVKALICIGPHCFWGTIHVLRGGNVATLEVPPDPALIGLDVRAWVPSTGQIFVGRISAPLRRGPVRIEPTRRPASSNGPRAG